MANPNLANLSSILGGVAYAAPANTSANTLLSNASGSSTILRINSLYVSNVTGSAALVTVSVNSAAAGSGTAYRIAYQISVPANSTMQIIDKNNMLYLTENTSLVVTSGTSGSLEYVASYETIS